MAGYFRSIPSVAHGNLVRPPPKPYTIYGRILGDRRRRTGCSRIATTPAEDRVRDLLQQSEQEATHRYRVEGAQPASQVQRRLPDEFLPTFPLQRNGAALRHLQ